MKTVMSLCLSALVCAAMVAAQPLPAGSAQRDGTWKLVPDKSDFGPQHGPDDGNLVLKVKTNGPEFEIEQITTERTERYVFRTDGKDMTNPLPDGGELKGHYSLENGVLVGELNINDGALVFKDRISYSANGRFMTLDREISGQMAGKMKIVLEREQTGHAAMAGTWKLDREKSDFGGPMPEKYQAVLAFDGHACSLRQITDEGDYNLKFRDDGEETTNQLPDMTMKSRMHWEDDVLVGSHVYTGANFEMTFTDRTLVSPDGKVLTIDRVGQTPKGERKIHIVMVRE